MKSQCNILKKEAVQNSQSQVLKSAASVNVAALKASYLVANRTAKAKKLFDIGEQLILPTAKDNCMELFG